MSCEPLQFLTTQNQKSTKKKFIVWQKSFDQNSCNLQGLDLVYCPAEVRNGQWLFVISQPSIKAAKVSMFWMKV